MHIHISIANQSLTLVAEGDVVASYSVSTSAKGIGFEEGSYTTPTGKFEIYEKIGGDQPIGTIFRSRLVEGLWTGESGDEDLVLTRILRLHGLDSENSNSMERYIYIHGTNYEELLGQPVSSGCIRMSNQDVIDLYERIEEGTFVLIEA